MIRGGSRDIGAANLPGFVPLAENFQPIGLCKASSPESVREVGDISGEIEPCEFEFDREGERWRMEVTP
jgi:hypothetical protein